MTWWDALAEYLNERASSDAGAPDPWAGIELGDLSLTDEQIAYLGFDQPGIPRLGGLTGSSLDRDEGGDPIENGTGNSPGDD